MNDPDTRLRGSIYKSLETDEEFLARLDAAYSWWNSFGATGAGLDELAWISFGMQRRIIEREATASRVSPHATR